MVVDNRDAGQIRMDEAVDKMLALPEVHERLRQQTEEMLWRELQRLHENVAKLHIGICVAKAQSSGRSQKYFEQILEKTGYVDPE